MFNKLLLKLIKIKNIILSKIRLSRFNNVGKNVLLLKPCRVVNPKYVSIGDNVTILNNLRIECIDKWGQSNYTPNITIGNNCNIEQNVHITSAGIMQIGKNVSILANCCVTNINHRYDDVNIAPKYQNLDVHDVIIGDNCFIGMNSCIFPGTTLGNHVVVGANSVVKGEFPSYCVIAGVPARIIKVYKDGKWVRYDYQSK